MKKVLKVLKWVGIGVLIIAILGSCFGVWMVRKGWPDYSGSLKVKGLKAEVTVKRDKYGVPNIYAKNEDDLFFAQGYVHAQDRLWQMEVSRRLCKGTMSEIAGTATLNLDKTVRLFALYKNAEKSVPLLDNGTKKVLEAYCRGINAYIDAHKGKLPLEFTIMHVKPVHWTIVDVISWGNFMAYSTGQNYRYEVFRGNLTAKLGGKMADEALPPTEDSKPQSDNGVQDFSWLVGADAKEGVDTASMDLSKSLGWASGAWAVQGRYTKSGKAMLTSDAHMELNSPSMWYENGLHGGRFDVVGYSFPGVPMVVLGHNSRISWGFTNMNPDVEDLYIEKLDNYDDPSSYQYKGKWLKLEKRKEIIKVKGQKKPVAMNVMSTIHGPLMKDLFQVSKQDRTDLKNYKSEIGFDTPLRRERWNGADTLSLRWPIFEGSTAMRAIYQCNMASNWKEFREGLQYWDSLSQNFVYADVDGNIGYQSAGKVPIRNAKHVGSVPVPGWNGEFEWNGYIPFNELPNSYNPSCGYVVSANNKMAPGDYKYNLSYDWFHPGYRSKRITELLEKQISSGKKFTKADMENILSDTFNYSAKELVPYVTSALKPESENQKKALEYLKKWDYFHDIDSVAAAIYTVWFSYASRDVYDDELSKYDIWGPHLPMKRILSMVRIFPDKNDKWFDNVLTAKVENRDDIINTGFKQAIDWLEKEYGKDPSKWTLGRVQTVQVKDTVFGDVPYLKKLYNSKTYPMKGCPVSVSFAYSYTNPPGKYNVRFGSTQTQIMDVGDWNSMQAINLTGENAQLFHSNRWDQTNMWANNEYFTMPYSKKAVDSTTKHTLTLKPKE